MITATTPALIGYPPAPTNGGALQYALPKIGDWAWEPKVDDRRVAIHAPTQTIYNQYGELSIADRQPDKFKAALETLSFASYGGFEWLDCGLMEYRHDMMRGCIIVFDIMANNAALDYRRAILEATFDAFSALPLASALLAGGPVHDRVFLINQWRNGDTAVPLKLEYTLKHENAKIGRKFYEGLVAKRTDGIYPIGTRAKQKTHLWVKHRFDQ
jgi:ATP-dependent DNA ligase